MLNPSPITLRACRFTGAITDPAGVGSTVSPMVSHHLANAGIEGEVRMFLLCYPQRIVKRGGNMRFARLNSSRKV